MLLLGSVDRGGVARLLAGYGVALQAVRAGEPIPGSYWGDSEAGLRLGSCFG